MKDIFFVCEIAFLVHIQSKVVYVSLNVFTKFCKTVIFL